jgi:hypothetical protein
LKEAFLQFVQRPSGESYRAIWKLVTQHSDYAPYADDLRQIDQLLAEQKYREAHERIGAVTSRWLLSPTFHILAALTHRNLGDQNGERMEQHLAMICLRGIIDTGTGTMESPYMVTCIRDEYDVLQHVGKKSKSQRVATLSGQALDCHTCEDGSEICFDVTAMKRKLDEQFKSN